MIVNAKNLKKLRKEKGVRQEVVARETGLSIKTIYRYECGRVKRYEVKTVEKLVKYYGVEVSDILETNDVG